MDREEAKKYRNAFKVIISVLEERDIETAIRFLQGLMVSTFEGQTEPVNYTRHTAFFRYDDPRAEESK